MSIGVTCVTSCCICCVLGILNLADSAKALAILPGESPANGGKRVCVSGSACLGATKVRSGGKPPLDNGRSLRPSFTKSSCFSTTRSASF